MATANEMVTNCSYQTPDEHNRSSYFAHASEAPSTSLPTPKSPLRRPPFVPRPSTGPGLDVEAKAADVPANEHADSNEPSPNTVTTGKEKQSGFKKVGLRDRIACHTWTWFTMVFFQFAYVMLMANE